MPRVQTQANYGISGRGLSLLSRPLSSSSLRGLLSSDVPSSSSSSFSSLCGLSCGLPMSSLSSVMFRAVVVVLMVLMALVPPTEQFIGFNGGALTRTLQTLVGTSCEGGTLTITCPSATVISVQNAKFGRSVPFSEMCAPTPKPGRSAGDPSRLGRLLHEGGYYGYAGAPLEKRDGGRGGEGAGRMETLTPRENTACLAIRSLQVRTSFLLVSVWVSLIVKLSHEKGNKSGWAILRF